MLRTKIKIPDDCLLIYAAKIPVLINHVNYGNHLGHDSLISILHEARMRLFKSHGIVDEISFDDNIGYVIADLNINYLNEAFYGEELTIKIYSSKPQKIACVFYYQVSNEMDKLVAMASTTLFFINFKTKKPVSIPEKFLQIVEKK